MRIWARATYFFLGCQFIWCWISLCIPDVHMSHFVRESCAVIERGLAGTLFKMTTITDLVHASLLARVPSLTISAYSSDSSCTMSTQLGMVPELYFPPLKPDTQYAIKVFHVDGAHEVKSYEILMQLSTSCFEYIPTFYGIIPPGEQVSFISPQTHQEVTWYTKYPSMVLELLDYDLIHFINIVLRNSTQALGTRRSLVQDILKQILQLAIFFEKHHIVHNGFKSENIMIKELRQSDGSCIYKVKAIDLDFLCTEGKHASGGTAL